MKWFKKNRFNIFTYLFCAFSMALLFIVSFSCKTYAYSIDSNGNLVGDNLLSTDTQFYVGGGQGNFTRQNNQIIFNVTEASDFYIYSDLQEFNPGTYTFSLNSYDNIQLFVIATQNTWLSSLPRDYTFSFDQVENLYFRIDVNESFVGSLTINFMINEGSTKMDWEPYGVWYSETNYDTLENQYDNLNNTYQRVLQENQYGFFNYVGSVLFIYTEFDSIRQVRLTRDTLINQGILLNGGIFNPNAIVESDLIQGAINFSFDLETGAPWEVINFYLMENDNYVVNIQIEDDEENTINLTKSHSNDILDNYVTPNEIYTKFLETGVNNLDIILRISFNFQSFDTSARVVSANNGSYNLGYEDGAQFYKSNYNNALRQINLDNTQINNLKQDLVLLQSAYNDLNQSYQNSLNGNNFANLFFTIAETPFASFKQIWSVDFLGVNLAGFVTGILFIGVLIWVVKKIF